MRGERNGHVAAIVAFIAAHPGCTAPQIEAHIGLGPSNGLLSYCVKQGRVFQSGRRRFFRYYTTAALACANDAMHKAEAAALISESKARTRRRDQLRSRARRHARGAKPVNTRPSQCLVRLEPEVLLAGDVKITTIKAPPGRFEVVGPFTGQITQDWLQRLPPEARKRER
jgi:hypothetical protein